MSAYQIEIEKGGCDRCASGRLWRVVGPGDISESTLYEREDDAQDLADSMNSAYEKGAADSLDALKAAEARLSELDNDGPLNPGDAALIGKVRAAIAKAEGRA